jgi:S-adenosylmethionine decarboxylase
MENSFNNLQKFLSLNLYFFSKKDEPKTEWIKDIETKINQTLLKTFSLNITKIIGSDVIHISEHSFQPYGKSQFTLLKNFDMETHLSKSHISIHTYSDLDSELSTYRIDIDLSTCGVINPLKSLNYIIDFFNPDVIHIDFLIRGFKTVNNKTELFDTKQDLNIKNYLENFHLKNYKHSICIHNKNRIAIGKMVKKNRLESFVQEMFKKI